MRKLSETQVHALQSMKRDPAEVSLFRSNTRHSLYMLGLIVGSEPGRGPYTMTASGRAAADGKPWKPARLVHFIGRPDGSFEVRPMFSRNRALAQQDPESLSVVRSMVEPQFRKSYPHAEPLMEGDATCPTCGDLYDADPREFECPRCAS